MLLFHHSDDPANAVEPRKGFHSHSYHRFFEGFTEYAEKNAKGKTVIRRIYTGVYWRQKLDAVQRKNVLIRYAAAAFLGCGSFLFSSLQNIESNRWAVSAFLQLAALASMLWLIVSLIRYGKDTGNKMTIRQYRESAQAVLRSSIVSTFFAALSFLAALFSPWLHRESFSLSVWAAAVGYLLSALSLYTIFRKEKSIDYEKEPNPVTPETFQGGTEIE